MGGKLVAVWTLSGAVLLAACASSDPPPRPRPVELGADVDIDFRPAWLRTGIARRYDGAPCKIRIGEVRDSRPEPDLMGSIGARTVLPSDGAQWVRSGFALLEEDKRLAWAETGEDLLIDVEILRSYASARTTASSFNVAALVVFSRDGVELDRRNYRGIETRTNWASGDGEIAAGMGRALLEMVGEVHPDVIRHCEAVLT